jgi:hypothetical protein
MYKKKIPGTDPPDIATKIGKSKYKESIIKNIKKITVIIEKRNLFSFIGYLQSYF